MSPKRIFLILTTLGTILLGISSLNFYPQLSQGDHGRDLYSAQAVLRGELPYKDFWWVYGPLMPYYFALFYKIAGGTVASFLVGTLFLKVLSAVFFYLAATMAMAPSIACLAAIWFIQGQQDFFFTFDHLGGICAELYILFLLFSYIKTQHLKTLWLTIPGIVTLSFIKINFGLTALLMVFITAWLTDHINRIPWTQDKKKLYLCLAALPLGIAFAYWLLLKDLPLYEIRQCFPYFGDDQPHHYPLTMIIPYYFTQHWLTFIHGPINMVLGVITHSATLATIFLVTTKRIKPQPLLLQISVLGIYFFLNFQEFLMSGVWYRTYWSLPFLYLFHFLTLNAAFSVLPILLRRILWSAFWALILLGLVGSTISTEEQKIPPRFLNGAHGQVYVGNELEWTDTVNTVTAYLNEHLGKDELFFALPYDCIYYFMTGKESPTRQLIFFDHIKIPTEQEVGVIRDLENKKVNYIVMSNRIASSEVGLGIFGKTYCPLIYQYMNDKFTPVVRQGGNWQEEPGWGRNHGVVIFKRK